MKYWLFLLLGLPLLLRAEIVWQADIQKPFAMTIKLSSQQVALDDFVNLEAEIHFPSSYDLDAESLLDQLTWSANPLAPRLNLHESSIVDLPENKGMQVKRMRVILNPLITGSIDISFMAISFLPKESNQSSLRFLTPVFHLQVLPSLYLPASLPLAPPSPLEPQFPLGLTQANRLLLIDNLERLKEEKIRIQQTLERHTFPWFAAIILMGCGGIFWVAYLMRDRWPKLRSRPIIAPSPKQQIDQAFDNLQRKHLLEQGFFQTYYTNLSTILLIALKAHLGWKTQEMTTTEIDQALKDDLTLSLVQKQALLSWLTSIDQVKYAGKIPSLEEAKQITQQIQDFIRQLFSTHKNAAA